MPNSLKPSRASPPIVTAKQEFAKTDAGMKWILHPWLSALHWPQNDGVCLSVVSIGNLKVEVA